jgi:hypothetical protein
METPFKPGESVRMNLAGMQGEGTLFHAAVLGRTEIKKGGNKFRP